MGLEGFSQKPGQKWSGTPYPLGTGYLAALPLKFRATEKWGVPGGSRRFGGVWGGFWTPQKRGLRGGPKGGVRPPPKRGGPDGGFGGVQKGPPKPLRSPKPPPALQNRPVDENPNEFW